jgi:chemosensory pili system protein ChpA (sensor histidine kinase/response regulator)
MSSRARTAAPIADDVSALAWVQGELRRTLDGAHRSLRRYLKEAEASGRSDVDAVDPAILRSARLQIHQGVGALELVGLPSVARVLHASEAAVQRMMNRPELVDVAAVEAIERASFAVLDFLGRMVAGKPLSPVALFPQYRAAQQLAGADRVHPADLWVSDFQWRELPPEPGVAPRASDEAARARMEAGTLALLRSTDATALRRMSQLAAELGAGAERSREATIWRLAAAVFDAQSRGLLAADVYAKRLASRLLAQLRLALRGQHEPSERLAQDLLFFCAHAQVPDTPDQAPRLAAVRQCWQLGSEAGADYEAARLGRFDPAVVAVASRRVAAARDGWSAVAGGDLHRLATLPEQFTLVGDSLARLLPDGGVLAQSLQAAAAHTVAGGRAPPPPLAMEVATAILYLDATIEDGDLDSPELGARVRRLAGRIDHVRSGGAPAALEPWMEELYRRVSDRQTMGSVVQELRAQLSDIEKHIDQYFRDPSDRRGLIPVPGQLQAMRGVLSVLGLDHASQAVLRMRDDVDALAAADPSLAPPAGTIERVADNLGALSFLIDMLGVQPALAKSLFRFDAASGQLVPVGTAADAPSVPGDLSPAEVTATVPAPLVSLPEQTRALAEAAARPSAPDLEIERALERLAQHAVAAEQAGLARTAHAALDALRAAGNDAQRHRVRQDLARALGALAEPAVEPPPPPPAAPARTTPAAAPGRTGLEDDPELREIFLEEAREVLTEAGGALERLADTPGDVSELTVLRRAFHTLKGSSRMVGLRDFGEAAWSCEQLYNARLATAPQLDPALRQFTADALGVLATWTEAIAAGHDPGAPGAALAAAADALRLQGTPRASAPAPAASSAPPAPAPGRQSAAESTPSPPAFEPESPLSEVESTLPILPLNNRPAGEAEGDAAADLELPEIVEGLDLDAGDSGLEAERLGDLGIGAEPTLPWPAPPAAEPLHPTGAARSLADHVPGLPHAADLDLGAPRPSEAEPAFELDLGALEEPAPSAAETTAALPAAAPDAGIDDDQIRVVGPLRIAIPLFNIFLNEADELSRRLAVEIAEWSVEPARHPVPETSVALAHSLAGSSATVGYVQLSQLARALEHALERSRAVGHGRAGEPELFGDAAEEIRRLLHQFAAGFLPPVPAMLMTRLADHERWPSHADAALAEGRPSAVPARPDAADDPSDIDAVDAVDPELFPVFDEEATELLRQLQSELRGWHEQPSERGAAAACMRTLHTFKGAARLAGAMRLGEMAHRLEGAVEALAGREDVTAADLEPLLVRCDAMTVAGDALRRSMAQPHGDSRRAPEPALDAAPQAAAPLQAPEEPAAETALAAAVADAPLPAALSESIPAVPAEMPSALQGEEPAAASGTAVDAPPLASAAATPEALAEGASTTSTVPAPMAAPSSPIAPPADVPAAAPALPGGAPGVDWARLVAPLPGAAARDDSAGAVGPGAAPGAAGAAGARAATGGAAVRVRAGLLDRLVNQAGEVSIARERIAADARSLHGSLDELGASLERMRRHLRDIELHSETQIASRIESARAAGAAFDPLEMDRFTRFQELTRFMAESVNDVATLQRSLQRALQSTEDELAAQARATRELQDDLLRTRMVEFESLSERLHRTVRQAARESGKSVRLDIDGGAIEVDRGVLERMVGPFEHLLRNSVVHGIEPAAQREAAGKDAAGRIAVQVSHVGNEVLVEIADDGAGFDYERIRRRGVERGLLAPEAAAAAGPAELAELLFVPGFSTADGLTELAGRGVGLDVVRAEVNAMGGRIETASERGRGTRVRLLLPLTTAVTQVVMLRCGAATVAVPSTLVEIVRRVPAAEVESAYASGRIEHGSERVPFFWLPALLQSGSRGDTAGRSQSVVIVRSAAQRVAVHVDEVVGNQEVVVKNIGPQLSRMPGLAGVTLLPSGAVALIYNPVALAATYAEEARARMRPAPALPAGADARTAALPVASAAARAPLVLVVDDSLTVRRATQRLLTREGYRVELARDGLDALEKLAAERPSMLLSDIEMPRMDGFDLVRNVRADARLADLPVVMVTSRIAQKHRDYAASLGVQHYLGKPYAEDELLALVARYATSATSATH